jgi:ABC-type bacteriocin/lantibiotic exporter with double-glycine peptidase domain
MVLAYLGRPVPYERLVELLGTRWFGTPACNIERLEQTGVAVVVADLSLSDMRRYLQDDLPVIAFVSTADLPYWSEDTDHAVVVVGLDDETVYFNDPNFAQSPQQVPRPAFELAQLRFDHRCAVLQLK